MDITNKITSYLSELIGKKLHSAGRASNLFWLGLGETTTVIRRGKTEESAECYLHIQCSWRIVQHNKILIASRDFYSPRSDYIDDDENFEWDVIGNNLFDERMKTFIQSAKKRLVVEKIESDEIGGLKVFLSDSYVLEVFPDSSQNDEFWRFFTRNDISPHFVVYRNGIDLV